MKVFLSTADASGDLHAAALVEALGKRCDGLRTFGLGGDALKAAGFEVLVHQNEIAVGGLIEQLRSTGVFLRIYTKLRSALKTEKPDLAIFIDSPDLNMPITRVAHSFGIPVLYYIAPQVWAWRTGRVRKLRRRVDHVGVIFEFEEKFLRENGVNATFVGHPLVARINEVKRALDREQVARELEIDLSRPVLSLLPGSRRNELASNLAYFLETAEILHRLRPSLQIQLLLAPTLADRPPEVPDYVRLVIGQTHEAMAVSTMLLAVPGTVTLEAAMLEVPMVVAIRTNRLSFGIIRRLSRVPSSCMVNLIADAPIVPERLQEQARPVTLAALLGDYLDHPKKREEMRAQLAQAIQRLGGERAADRAAELALKVAHRA